MSTAHDLLGMLRRHYIPRPEQPGGIFAPEIQAPGSQRRADLIWQGVTASSGHALIGHEIKVSRADLLAELADPTKSDPWQRYCDRWYLVLPSMALADGLTLPDTWGVLTPPSGRRTRAMTVAVPAPKLNPDEPAPALRTLATWLHWREHRAAAANERNERTIAAQADQLRELRNDMRRLPPESTGAQFVRSVVDGLGGIDERGWLGDWDSKITAADVVLALKDLQSVRKQTAEVEDARSSAHRWLEYANEAITRALGGPR